MKNRNAVTFLGMFYVLFVFSGCGDQPHPMGVGGEPSLEISSMDRNRGLFVKRIVGEKGGTVHLWHHSITIPKGALEENTWVSISWKDLSLPIFDYGPDGIEFLNDQPAKIRISYKRGVFGDLNLENLHVDEWDEERDQWIRIGGTVNREEEYIEVYVVHLSRYALSDR